MAMLSKLEQRRLVNRLTAVRLALQYLDQRAELPQRQRAVVQTALAATDDLRGAVVSPAIVSHAASRGRDARPAAEVAMVRPRVTRRRGRRVTAPLRVGFQVVRAVASAVRRPTQAIPRVLRAATRPASCPVGLVLGSGGRRAPLP